jgi:hypothetical protein
VTVTSISNKRTHQFGKQNLRLGMNANNEKVVLKTADLHSMLEITSCWKQPKTTVTSSLSPRTSGSSNRTWVGMNVSKENLGRKVADFHPVLQVR